MSIKERMAAKTASIAPLSGVPRPANSQAEPKTGPGKFLAAMPFLAEKEEELEKATAENASLREHLEKALRETGQTGTPIEIPLDQLHEVPGRRRYKSPEKFAELRENLRHNPLIDAVVVLPRPEGGFNIQSGHHRVDAYRDLGRTKIECVLGKSTGNEASAGAFYANLMQSDLTDYEKYIGFKEILASFPGTTQAQVAEQAGVAASVVSKLMAFEQLPEAVLARLKRKPDLLGSTSGYALAVLTKEGKSERVIAAVERLAKGEIDQTQAVKLAATEPAKPKGVKPEGVKVRVGRAVYCDVRTARNVVRMEFQSEDEARAIQDELKTLLEARAERLRALSKDAEK
jgi:ParB family chromosome partitioning protein